jgi:hypothetical protein
VSHESSATPPDQVPYENTADIRWAREAMDLYRGQRLAVAAFDTIGVVSAHVWGSCPRCGHDINVQPTLTVPVPETRGLWTALTGRAAPMRQGIPESVEVDCGCGRSHPGAPEEVLGCGVSFRLPTAPPPAEPHVSPTQSGSGTDGPAASSGISTETDNSQVP